MAICDRTSHEKSIFVNLSILNQRKLFCFTADLDFSLITNGLI